MATTTQATTSRRSTPSRFLDLKLTLHLFRSEPTFDDDDVEEFYEPEVAAGDENEERAPDADEGDIVVSGDPSAAANAQKGGSKSSKDKKIATEDRTTTPYMTKYEKARILGTRALQIRYATPRFL